jgi:hypothetical protein
MSSGPFDFGPFLVVDQSSLAPLAGVTLLVFPQGTADFDPGNAVPVTDLNDLPIAVLTPDARGYLQFRQADHPALLLSSGTQRQLVISGDGMVADTAASAASAAASAAAAATLASASALPSGGTTGQTVVKTIGGSLVWGAPAMTAAGVSFTPTGALTATNVQSAVAQAASLGGSGGSGSLDVLTCWRSASLGLYRARIGGAWVPVPAANSGMYIEREFIGSQAYTGVTWSGVLDRQLVTSADPLT